MKPELKATWVATLRSGNYKQGLGRLRNRKNECCCLGVLCDIAKPDGWRAKKFYDGCVYEHLECGPLPDCDFLDEIRLSYDIASHLSNMNDGGVSFSDLADWIEKNA